MKNMTLGGRLTMINSYLGNLTLYYMSIFKMPVAAARKLEKIQRQFFWENSVEKRRLHLVNWDRVTRSKKK